MTPQEALDLGLIPDPTGLSADGYITRETFNWLVEEQRLKDRRRRWNWLRRIFGIKEAL